MTDAELIAYFDEHVIYEWEVVLRHLRLRPLRGTRCSQCSPPSGNSRLKQMITLAIQLFRSSR
jgi:hypothetical protein